MVVSNTILEQDSSTLREPISEPSPIPLAFSTDSQYLVYLPDDENGGEVSIYGADPALGHFVPRGFMCVTTYDDNPGFYYELQVQSGITDLPGQWTEIQRLGLVQAWWENDYAHISLTGLALHVKAQNPYNLALYELMDGEEVIGVLPQLIPPFFIGQNGQYIGDGVASLTFPEKGLFLTKFGTRRPLKLRLAQNSWVLPEVRNFRPGEFEVQGSIPQLMVCPELNAYIDQKTMHAVYGNIDPDVIEDEVLSLYNIADRPVLWEKQFGFNGGFSYLYNVFNVFNDIVLKAIEIKVDLASGNETGTFALGIGVSAPGAWGMDDTVTYDYITAPVSQVSGGYLRFTIPPSSPYYNHRFSTRQALHIRLMDAAVLAAIETYDDNNSVYTLGEVVAPISSGVTVPIRTFWKAQTPVMPAGPTLNPSEPLGLDQGVVRGFTPVTPEQIAVRPDLPPNGHIFTSLDGSTFTDMRFITHPYLIHDREVHTLGHIEVPGQVLYPAAATSDFCITAHIENLPLTRLYEMKVRAQNITGQLNLPEVIGHVQGHHFLDGSSTLSVPEGTQNGDLILVVVSYDTLIAGAEIENFIPVTSTYSWEGLHTPDTPQFIFWTTYTGNPLGDVTVAGGANHTFHTVFTIRGAATNNPVTLIAQTTRGYSGNPVVPDSALLFAAQAFMDTAGSIQQAPGIWTVLNPNINYGSSSFAYGLDVGNINIQTATPNPNMYDHFSLLAIQPFMVEAQDITLDYDIFIVPEYLGTEDFDFNDLSHHVGIFRQTLAAGFMVDTGEVIPNTPPEDQLGFPLVLGGPTTIILRAKQADLTHVRHAGVEMFPAEVPRDYPLMFLTWQLGYDGGSVPVAEFKFLQDRPVSLPG